MCPLPSEESTRMFAIRILALLGVGAGLLALGYFVGREVGRLEPVREELRHRRIAHSEPE